MLEFSRHAGAAPARARVPQPRDPHRSRRRAHRAKETVLPLRGRHPDVRRAAEPHERAPPRADLPRRRARRARRQGDVEVALQWHDGYQEHISYCTNTINNRDGGAHLSGFRSALTRTLNNYAAATGLFQDAEGQPERRGLPGGLTAIVSVKVPDPQFEGQTKTKLGNSEVKGSVEQVVNDMMALPRGEPPRRAAILDKVVQAARAREAARKARELVAPQGRPPRRPARQAGGLHEPRPGRRPSCSWSRATRPAARRSRDATVASRPSCRSRARSSTSRRRASTRCSAPTRSGDSSRRSAPASAEDFDVDAAPLPQDRSS